MLAADLTDETDRHGDGVWREFGNSFHRRDAETQRNSNSFTAEDAEDAEETQRTAHQESLAHHEPGSFFGHGRSGRFL